MRRIRNFTILSVMLMVTSCSDDFIELAPISEGNAENFYQTNEDFEAAIIATYSNLQSPSQYGSNDTRFGGSFYALMEVRADDASDGDASSGAGRDIFDIDTFFDNPLSSVIEDAWLGIFKTIYDANAIISRLNDANIDTASKTQYESEARFLRALSYFNAVRLWGDVPVILEDISPQEAQALSRDNVAAVYAAIEADFEYAAQNLPSSFPGQEGRATSGAASAFLGKALLTQQKFGEAASVLQNVVQSRTYSLLPNVNDVFAIDNELNQEIIFSVRFATQVDVSHLGFGTPAYTQLLDLYDSSDNRLSLLEPIGSGDPDGTYPAKQYESSDGQLGRDFPVLRYSDVLLMLSEALNEQGYLADGEAFEILNQVRIRAGIEPYTSTDLTTQSDFREAVLEERRLELALELHRWFDLLRTNRAIEALGDAGIGVQEYQLLYPIPQNEINVYNNESQFQQNPGY